MLWPFNHFRKPRNPTRGTIEAIYGMIVTQAREPLFYRDLGVPDTVNGRFDLLVLHLWMVLRRLKPIDQALAAGAEPLAQALCKNILNGKEIENARRLAFYAEAAIAYLAGLDDVTLQSGSCRFPSPARVSVQQ